MQEHAILSGSPLKFHKPYTSEESVTLFYYVKKYIFIVCTSIYAEKHWLSDHIKIEIMPPSIAELYYDVEDMNVCKFAQETHTQEHGQRPEITTLRISV